MLSIWASLKILSSGKGLKEVVENMLVTGIIPLLIQFFH